ncbi:E3 ubiquitin-protein ligase rnf146-like [Haliotis rufescens]|uniref:E3 ubiquitin-protein ligase rnf146-like n=1 Tax=Haliotis rufescens TaxID=6454 RepID=UPI00201EFAD0|nr:E3 ubiquitin-protein ligase rnf146-like [Haliotis rufescens]
MSTESNGDRTTDIHVSLKPANGGENDRGQEDDAEDGDDPDCPVCLQTCIHPVQLPCSHIFCFLCVKGVASRSKRCALCRQDIPSDFFCRPNLVRKGDLQQTKVFDEEYQWFYEGQNGWWQYDDRTSCDMESHYKKGVKTFELLIAGYVYLIDLEKMIQCQRNDRTKKRRVKRDKVNLPGKKGVAGLKFGSNGSSAGVGRDCDSDRPGADGDETTTPTTHQIMVPIPIHPMDRTVGYTNSLSPPTPYNTPQTPQTPAESPPTTSVPSEQDLTMQLERLRLGDPSILSTSPQDWPPGARPADVTLGAGLGGADGSEVFTRVRPRGLSETCSEREADAAEDVRAGLQETETEIYNQIQEDMEQTEPQTDPGEQLRKHDV